MSDSPALSSRERADDEKGLAAASDGLGQRRVRRLVRQVFFARKESHERSPPLGRVVANGSREHRVSGLERVEERTLGDLALELEHHFAVYLRQRPKVRGKYDADHVSV